LTKSLCPPAIDDTPVGHYVPLLEFNLIRGANIAALNNEALANTLTMIAATTARKVTERVTWCYYAVVGPQPEGSLAPLNSSPRDSRTVTFSLKH
jgi:hypothetical protein